MIKSLDSSMRETPNNPAMKKNNHDKKTIGKYSFPYPIKNSTPTQLFLNSLFSAQASYEINKHFNMLDLQWLAQFLEDLPLNNAKAIYGIAFQPSANTSSKNNRI